MKFVRITGRELRGMRAFVDWTQEECARRAGVSEDSVRQWEYCDVAKITARPDNLYSLMQAFLEAGVEVTRINRFDGERTVISKRIDRPVSCIG